MTDEPPFRIFGTVGTDHHPFDRLVEWIDRWLGETTVAEHVVAVVQAGSSTAPRRAEAAGILPFDEFQAALEQADAVVCHGGSSTIAQARLAGHRPLVVPRRPDLGEHVDEHQVRYAARLAERGEVVLVHSYECLGAALESARENRLSRRSHAETACRPEAVDRFAELVAPLIGTAEACP
jgi:UDP-N-acetylglucosamine transferase subunit ALG13